MTFSSRVKSEMCKNAVEKRCCAVSEVYGVLLYCNMFTAKEIRIITENRELAVRLGVLFKTAFGITVSEQPGRAAKKIFTITDSAEINRIFDAFGYTAETNIALHLNGAVIEADCCRAAFLRGAFLAGGSVTDPEKRYHLELATSHYNVSREVLALLLDMELKPKEIVRKSYYLLYFKQSGYIEDFLTLTGAQLSSLAIMEAKVEKDLRNDVNRRVNCDTANVAKAVDAAQSQLEAIRRLKDARRLETLPPKLKMAAELRLLNPEATLSELALMFDPPVSKSCLNHRLRKIAEIAGGIVIIEK